MTVILASIKYRFLTTTEKKQKKTIDIKVLNEKQEISSRSLNFCYVCAGGVLRLSSGFP